MLNLSVLGFSFVVFHDKAKRKQQEQAGVGHFITPLKARYVEDDKNTFFAGAKTKLLTDCFPDFSSDVASICS